MIQLRIDGSRLKQIDGATHSWLLCYTSRIIFCCLMLILFSPSTMVLANDYYPMNLGDIWLYDAKETGQDAYTQAVVIRQLPSQEQRGALKNSMLQVIRNFDTDQIREENRFTKDRNGINLHQAVVHKGKLLVTVTYNEPVRLLKFPLDLGGSWAGKSIVKIELKGEYPPHRQTTIQVLGEYVYRGKVVRGEIVSDAFGARNYNCRRVDIEIELTIKQIFIDEADRLKAASIQQIFPWRVDDLIKSQSSRWLVFGVGEIKFIENTFQPRQTPTTTSHLLKSFKPKE